MKENIDTLCCIFCCPFYCCMQFYLNLYKIYNPTFYLAEQISDKCFKIRLIGNDEIGINFNIGDKDWTNLYNLNSDLIDKFTKIIYKILIDLNINNYNLKNKQIQFISLQIKLYLKNCLANYYQTEKNIFKIEPLQERFGGFIEKKMCKGDFENFKERFKVMHDNSIIDLNTNNKNDIKILREKLYITIDSILEQKHDFSYIITSSLYYLEDIEKKTLREYNNRRKEQLCLN